MAVNGAIDPARAPKVVKAGVFRGLGRPIALAAAVLAAALLTTSTARATPFSSGSLVVERVGDGTTTLSGTAAQISVLEVTKSGSLTQTIILPSSESNQQTDAGQSTSQGYLNTYGGYVSVSGYNAAAGTAGVAASNTKVNSLLDVTGEVVTRTLFPTGGQSGSPPSPFSSNNYRSSIATSGSTFYGTGASAGLPNTGGAWYVSGTTFTQVSSTATGQPTNLRNVEIYNNQLYASAATSTGTGIWSIGSGLPTTASNTSTLAINTGTFNANASPYGFVLFSTGSQGSGVLDLAYIADDRTTAGGGLEKWTLSGTTWSNSWSLFVSGTPTGSNTLQSGTATNFAGLRGLAGTYDSVLGASLYATTTELNNNRLISILDTGTATPSTYTTLQSAGANYAFRGVDLSPTAAGPNALVWNTTTGTWNTTSTVWTTGTGGTLAFTNGDSVTFSGTGGGVVTISGSMQPSSITVSATSGTYTFVSSAGNLLTGTTGLAKSGGGTLILSGSTAFTGSTAVTGGSLLVNGVLSSTTTTVSGGLLGGSGTVGGAVQLAAGGTIAPGAAPGGTGILTLGSLSGTGGTFAMEITGTGAGQSDQLVTGGTLNYAGNTLQISIAGTYANGSSWDLFDFTTQSGTLAAISPIVADSAYNGLAWGLAATSANYYDQKYGAGIWLSDWSTGGQRFIFNQATGVMTVVPEPSTLVMAGAGIAGVALLRWRRGHRRARESAHNG